MSKSIVATTGACKPIGPYSMAVRAGGFVHFAGQLGWDFETGALVPGGIRAEARAAFENLAAVLAYAGLALGDIVKATVYLRDIADAPVVNDVWEAAFPEDPPARTLVEVTALPKGASIEIDAIAVDV